MARSLPVWITLVFVAMASWGSAQTDSTVPAAQADEVATKVAPEYLGIPAIDSDFLFMKIEPSSLPFEGAGMGVFAKVEIAANEILCEYRGATIPEEQAFNSNYLYSSKKITGEGFHIVPDMNKPICAIINDCALIVGNNYTNEELEAYEANDTLIMPTYPGYAYNARPMFTLMGKVFIISNEIIPAGAEIFYSYGNRYWVPRIKFPEYFKF